jgi:hypothetical protein
MRRLWLEILMGLAAIQPSPSSAAAVSHYSPTTKPQSTFYINKPSTNDNGDIAPRVQQQVPRASAEHKLIFDTSDSRRALDDWELENYVLVATIEGHLFALDRYSGTTKWVLEGDGAAVRSVGNKYFSEPVNETRTPWVSSKEQQPKWIVQPVEGGQLFLFDSESGVLVRAIFRVKQLIDRNFR